MTIHTILHKRNTKRVIKSTLAGLECIAG